MKALLKSLLILQTVRLIVISLGNRLPQSVTIDLGSVKEFNELVADTAVGAYHLEVSDDKLNWEKVLSETGNTGRNIHQFTSTSGRYIKFTATQRDSHSSSFSMLELEIYNRSIISEDEVLRGLSLSEGVLSPTFNSKEFKYTSVVGSETDSIMVTPKQKGANATVKVNGITVKNGEASDPISLITGKNIIEVLVQDSDNEACFETYEILVTKKDYSTSEYGNVILKNQYLLPDIVGGSGIQLIKSMMV